jgi:hypothetical protein
MIDQPGVYDIPAATYHADPWPGGSLSHTGARKLLPPSCPAHYRHWVDHGEPPKADWDFGHVVHGLLFGIGDPVKVIDADSWQTKAAQGARKAAYTAGEVPILRSDHIQAQDMVDALFQHPHAAELLHEMGQPEQSLFWVDEATEVPRRARLDYLLRNGDVIDYKTCNSAAPSAIAKSMVNYGYFMQAPWYQDAVVDVGLADYPPEFTFIFQEKTPPYVVTVATPDEEMLAYGRAQNREAIELYYQCKTFDHWPGYADGPVTVSLPRWAIRELESA